LVLAADALVGSEAAALLSGFSSKRLGGNLAGALLLDGSVLAEIDLGRISIYERSLGSFSDEAYLLTFTGSLGSHDVVVWCW